MGEIGQKQVCFSPDQCRRRLYRVPCHYAMLAKFEEMGIIRPTAYKERRKSYIITDKGRHELEKEYQRLQTLIADGAFYFAK